MLLQQEHAAETRDLLQRAPLADVATTDFSIHSIGIILTNGGKDDDFGKFVIDVLQDTPIAEVRLGVGDLSRLLDVRTRHHLDFDDAYQYVAAEKHNLTLVSFDADFDRTDRGRKTPVEVLEEPPVVRDKPPTKPRRPRARIP
jgi:predicted nucleic acid-binding protein